MLSLRLFLSYTDAMTRSADLSVIAICVSYSPFFTAPTLKLVKVPLFMNPRIILKKTHNNQYTKDMTTSFFFRKSPRNLPLKKSVLMNRT